MPPLRHEEISKEAKEGGTNKTNGGFHKNDRAAVATTTNNETDNGVKLCSVCGNNGPFSVRQLKRKGKQARCSQCIQDNIGSPPEKVPEESERKADTSIMVVASNNKRKRIYFSDGGSVSRESSPSSSSSSTSSPSSSMEQVMDVSLNDIKRNVLGRLLQTNDRPDHESTTNNDDELIDDANIENLRKDLTCAICHEIFHSPVSLCCGHSFCHDCVHWWLQRSNSCPTCRSKLTATKEASIGINTALRACVTTLFQEEVRQREQADFRAKQKAISGEHGGAHSKGYESIEALEDALWKNVQNRFNLSARRSIVMDANDQRMQLAMAIHGDEPIEFVQARNGKNGELHVTLCLLTMEEDEASDVDGFPLIVKEDDSALIVTEDRFQYSFVEATARIGGTVPMSNVPISRIGMRQGLVHFHIDLGTPALQNAVSIYFRDEETGVELEVRVPPPRSSSGIDPNRDTELSQLEEGNLSGMLSDNEDLIMNRSVDLDKFEDDGFVVNSSDEEDFEDDSDSSGIGLSDDNTGNDDEQHIEDVCVICMDGGELMVCDGGDKLPGCGKSFHIECVGRDVVPPGDWVCEKCANAGGINVGIEGFEFVSDDKHKDTHKNNEGTYQPDGGESDESSVVPPARKGKKAKRKAISDSDDDD